MRKSTRGKKGKFSNQIEEPPEITPKEEPTTFDNMPSSVTSSVDINVKPEVQPEKENLKEEVTSTSPTTEIAGKEEEIPNIKQEDEVTIKESTAAEDTTEKRAVVKGILEMHFHWCSLPETSIFSIVACPVTKLLFFYTHTFFLFQRNLKEGVRMR